MKRNQQLRRRATLRLEPLEDRCLLSGGVLDPTFGTGGLVTTNLGTQNESFDYAVAVYHNQGAANEGKIVAAGTFLVSSRDRQIQLTSAKAVMNCLRSLS